MKFGAKTGEESMADPILLEIDGKILRNLIERDRLTVSDFRCFNQESKKKIREIYLQITKKKLLISQKPCLDLSLCLRNAYAIFSFR